MHQFSAAWDINHLHFFSWNFTYFQQKEPTKVQIWWNFTWAVKTLKFCTFIGSFCQNHIKFHLKKYRRVIQSLNKNWLVALLSNLTWEIWWIFITTLKSLENCTLMGSFCPKDIMFQVENFRGIMCHDTQEWYKIWRKTELWFEKLHKEFG